MSKEQLFQKARLLADSYRKQSKEINYADEDYLIIEVIADKIKAFQRALLQSGLSAYIGPKLRPPVGGFNPYHEVRIYFNEQQIPN